MKMGKILKKNQKKNIFVFKFAYICFFSFSLMSIYDIVYFFLILVGGRFYLNKKIP